MGKGDKKTKRGKIMMGSHGVRRARRKLAKTTPLIALKEEKPEIAVKGKAPAKPKAEKAEIQLELPEVEAPVLETVKPSRKKTPPKVSSKKEEKAEE